MSDGQALQKLASRIENLVPPTRGELVQGQLRDVILRSEDDGVGGVPHQWSSWNGIQEVIQRVLG